MKLHSKYTVLPIILLLSIPAYPMGWNGWAKKQLSNAWNKAGSFAQAIGTTAYNYVVQNPGTTALTAAGVTGAAALGCGLYNAFSTKRALPEYTVASTNSVNELLGSGNEIKPAHEQHDADNQVFAGEFAVEYKAINQPAIIVADPAYDAQLAQDILNPKTIEKTPIVAPAVKPAAKPQVRMRTFQEVIQEGLDAEGVSNELLQERKPNLNKVVLTEEDKKLDAQLVQQILEPAIQAAQPNVKLEDNAVEHIPASGEEIKTEKVSSAPEVKVNRDVLNNTIVKDRVSIKNRAIRSKDFDQKGLKKQHEQSPIDPMDVFLMEMKPIEAVVVPAPAVKQPAVKQPVIVAPVTKADAKPVAKVMPKPAAIVVKAAAVKAENKVLAGLLKQDEDGNTLLHKAVLKGNNDAAIKIMNLVSYMTISEYVQVAAEVRNKAGKSVNDLIKDKKGLDYVRWSGVVVYEPKK